VEIPEWINEQDILGRGSCGVVVASENNTVLKWMYSYDIHTLCREIVCHYFLDKCNITPGITSYKARDRYVGLEMGRCDFIMSTALLRQIPKAQRKQIAHSLIRAVYVMHERGFLHLDLKMSNIGLQKTGDDTWSVQLIDFSLSQYLPVSGNLCHEKDDLAYTAHVRPPEITMGCTRRRTENEVWVLGLLLSHIFNPDVDMMEYVPNQTPEYSILTYLKWPAEVEELRDLPKYEKWVNPGVTVLWRHLYEKLEVQAIEQCLCAAPSDRITIPELAKLLGVDLPETPRPKERSRRHLADIFFPEAPKDVSDSILEFCTLLRPRSKSIFVSIFLCTNMLPREIGMTNTLSAKNIRKCLESRQKKRKFTE
jgi:serine/threonine protein kinase